MKILLTSLIAMMLFAGGLATPAYAAPTSLPGAATLNYLQSTGLGGSESAEAAAARLPQIIGNIIRIILGLLGIVFLVLIVYAGFIWMTARGDTESVTKAKDIIRNSIIGVVIIFLAYAITGFVVNTIITATIPG